MPYKDKKMRKAMKISLKLHKWRFEYFLYWLLNWVGYRKGFFGKKFLIARTDLKKRQVEDYLSEIFSIHCMMKQCVLQKYMDTGIWEWIKEKYPEKIKEIQNND